MLYSATDNAENHLHRHAMIACTDIRDCFTNVCAVSKAKLFACAPFDFQKTCPLPRTQEEIDEQAEHDKLFIRGHLRSVSLSLGHLDDSDLLDGKVYCCKSRTTIDKWQFQPN